MESSRPLSWVALLWLVLCVGCCVQAFLFPTRHTVYPDYAHAGRSWVEGADAYNVEWDATGAFVPRMSGYRYAPIISIMMVPFSLCPDAVGGALWRLFNYVCFLGAFAWFVRVVLPGSSTLGNAGTAALWLLLLPLSLGSMHNGQANVMLMGLLLAAAAAVVTERWNLTAVFLAGACLLKVYPLAVALLMLVVYPRQLGWRFALALAVGLALPFALQHPGYVLGQYENWYQLMATDDRRIFAMNQGYRDFYLLARFIGAPLSAHVYLALQLVAAAGVAGVCLLGRLAHWPAKHLIQTLLCLGCSWMIVFGPSTESCTFILLAPALAWALVDAFRPGRPAWSRAVLVLVLAMFLATFTANSLPGGRDWLYVLQPVSALVFFTERFASCRPQPEPHVSATRQEFSLAA
jgi:hypothetical protein